MKRWLALLFFVARVARAQDAGVSEQTPVEQTPVEQAPVEQTPVEQTPVEQPSREATPPAQPSAPDPTAEDTSELEALLDESVVTTASRGAERISAAPANVYTITAREIQMFGIRTVDEALEFLGVSIYVQRPRDYDTGIDVGAQGLMDRDGGRRILVMLDGHVMNSQDTGQVTIHEGLGVPIEAIDHIEVMLGAGSVIYGSAAMSAVIHVFTRNVTDRAHVRFVAQLGGAPPTDVNGRPAIPDGPGGRFGLRYRLGAGADVPFRLFGSQALFTMQAEWLQEVSNSYAIPLFPADGFQVRPGETTWGGNGSHEMDAPSMVASLRVGDFRLAFQGNYYYRNIPMNGRFTDPLAREERGAARLDLSHSTLLIPEVRLATRLYGDFTHWGERTTWSTQNFCYPGQIDGCIFERASRGHSAGLEQILTVDWLLDGQFETTFGYDVRLRDTSARPSDSRDILTGDLPLNDTVPYFHRLTGLGGIFLQQVWRPASWIAINVGGRLDIDSTFGARLSPRGAVVITPVEGTTVRASYAEAFRAPSTFELFESDRTYRITPTGLRPEVVRTADLEWRQRVGFAELSVRGFFAFYEDIISSRLASMTEIDAANMRGELSPFADLTYILRYDNIAQTTAGGGQITISARPFEGFSLAASFTLQESFRNDQFDPSVPVTTARVPVLPEYYGNARVAYEFARDGATLALAARYAGRRTAINDFDSIANLDVGEQLDLRGTFTAPIDPIPGLRIRATASYSINAMTPYTLNGPTTDAPTTPLVFRPMTTPFFFFGEVQYVLDP